MAGTFTIRLPQELAGWLQRLAQETGVPRSQLIRLALEQSREDQDRPILRLAGMLDKAEPGA
jgi:predicted transcriptional regulator